MTITTHLLLALFSIPALTSGDYEDLCDIVNPDTGVPLRCEGHPDGAPAYDEPVCCDDSSCFRYDGGCPDSLQAHYCELGSVLTTGVVICYFEVPSYCDVFPCDPGYASQPQANMMCCQWGECWHVDYGDGCPIEDLYWCQDGVSNEDGTVTCFD